MKVNMSRTIKPQLEGTAQGFIECMPSPEPYKAVLVRLGLARLLRLSSPGTTAWSRALHITSKIYMRKKKHIPGCSRHMCLETYIPAKGNSGDELCGRRCGSCMQHHMET